MGIGCFSIGSYNIHNNQISVMEEEKLYKSEMYQSMTFPFDRPPKTGHKKVKALEVKYFSVRPNIRKLIKRNSLGYYNITNNNR